MTAPPTVPPTPLVEPLTVARLAADLNIPGGVDRLPAATLSELELHLRAVIRHVERKCGPILPRSVTFALRLQRYGRGIIPAGKWPLASIESATDVNLAPVSLTVEEDTGLVEAYPAASGVVTVVATVGRDPIPEDLALGILLIASHNYGVGQRVPGQGADRPPGFGGGGGVAPSPGYAIPNRAATFIAPHELAVTS